MKKFIICFCFCFSLFAASPIPFNPRIRTVVSGGGGGTPTFVSELTRNFETDSISPSTTAGLGATIPVNDRIVIIINWADATETVSSVSDTKGNTYTKLKEQLHTVGAQHNQSIWSANVGTGLTSTDTISITWGSPAFTYRTWAVFRVTGCNTTTQPDQSASVDSFNTTVTCAASTTAANTVAIGVVDLADNTHNYTGSNWTVSGTFLAWASASRNYYVYKNITASGSQDPGGTLGSNDNYAVCWVALK